MCHGKDEGPDRESDGDGADQQDSEVDGGDSGPGIEVEFVKPLDAAAEMGMLPDVMWDLRPVDFWRLYAAHKKRERQKIRMLSLQMMSNSSAENAGDAEIELYKDLWYVLTESKKMPEQAPKNPLEQMTEEERESQRLADIKMLEEMNKNNNPNG